MPQIDIDDATFAFLQSRARPLVDTPASVLRRLLLGEPTSLPSKHAGRPSAAEALTAGLLGSFRGPFAPVGRFRLLLDSPTDLVYVQNCGTEGDRQWYRVHEKPWQTLLASQGHKRCTLALVSTTRRQAYLLPVSEVAAHAAAVGWRRPALEINIDGRRHRWIELGWRIGPYLRAIRPEPTAPRPDRS